MDGHDKAVQWIAHPMDGTNELTPIDFHDWIKGTILEQNVHKVCMKLILISNSFPEKQQETQFTIQKSRPSWNLIMENYETK